MIDEPIHVSDAEFEEKVLKSDLPVIVDFWAPWCGPCHMIAPILEKLAAEYKTLQGWPTSYPQMIGLRYVRHQQHLAEERAEALKAENARLRSIVTVYVREKLAQEMNGSRLH